MNKKFRREVALFYAEQNEVDGVEPEEMKDLAVYRIVKDHVEELAKAETAEESKEKGEKLQPYECSPEDGGCGEIVRGEDPYCWCCGISQTGKKKDSFESIAKKAGKEPEKKPAKVPDEVKTKEEVDAEKNGGTTAAEESLSVFTERIRSALSDTGRNAWGIGRDLNAVKNGKLYGETGHESFKDWFQAEFRNIELSTAKAFMKIATTFEEDDCAQIGSSKLNVIKNAQPEDRPKLLKSAHKGATVSELRDKVRESREKKGGKKQGPPPASLFKKAVGQKFKGKFTDKKKSVAECKLDDLGVSAMVTVQAGGVKIEFVKTYAD